MRFISCSSKSIARVLFGCAEGRSEVIGHLDTETVSLQKSMSVQYNKIFDLDISEMNCFPRVLTATLMS